MKNITLGIAVGLGVALFAFGIYVFTAPVDEYALEGGYNESTQWDYVQSPEECTQYEYYDEYDQACYYECDSEQECAQIEALIDAELTEAFGNYEDFGGAHHEHGVGFTEAPENNEVLYAVERGEQYVVVEGEETHEHVQIRTWVAAVMPDELSDTHFVRLGIFNDPSSDTGAFVSDTGDGTWEMYVNRDVFSENKNEMVFTIIHEFAHILTLNNTQLNPAGHAEACVTFYTDEGCAYEQAYIHAFYDAFWDGKSDFDAATYTPEEFVTEYAATNVAEDIAESFTTFALHSRREGESLVDKKVNFFYAYPELVTIRSDLRQTLSSFVRSRAR